MKIWALYIAVIHHPFLSGDTFLDVKEIIENLKKVGKSFCAQHFLGSC